MHAFNPLSPPLPQKIGERLRWGSFYGSALGLAISNAARSSRKLNVIMTADMLSAAQMEDQLHFFAPDMAILSFPDWETLPYDQFSPHQDIISQRLATLYRLPQLREGILIVPITTLMQRIAPQAYLDASSFVLARGEQLHLDALRIKLERGGYRCVTQVMEHGEFAVRGSIFDIFPMGSIQPYRIDLLGDEVDSIRVFDPESQRSLEKMDKINLLPAREFPLTESAITQFRQRWRDKFAGNPVNCPIYQDISHGNSSPGIEYYLPLFFDNTATLFDYLPPDSLLMSMGNLVEAADNYWLEIRERYEQRSHDITRPLLSPMELFLPAPEIFNKINQFSSIQIQLESSQQYNIACTPPPVLLVDHKAAQPLAALQHFLQETQARLLFCTETAGRREALLELLKNIAIKPMLFSTWQEFLSSDHPLGITVAALSEGLCLTEPPLTIITENQLFGQKILQQRRRKLREYDSDAIVRNLTELHVGAPVVHIDHGVGRYVGLQKLTSGGIEAEYLTLEYAGGDKLYVPVASLHLISRYSGADVEQAPLHRLGTEQWQKAKRKAAEQIRDVAAELLELYARREARTGHQYAAPQEAYRAFSAAFPFEETPDQQQAIEAVIHDMTSGKSMDRLVCGDVGFGKTEVAMRAAFIATQESKQVALLVPTTLLAQQHYQNFTDRFADWPVNIDMISRFRSQKEQVAILDKLKSGKVDIIIGTHKLLQQDIGFSKLGLVIIDEEHRFGVRQKERLKALRAEVDILTLTATPIPRTLNMAMSGMRDLSIIATPPARRLSVKTFVREQDKSLIREAILREIMRGGQVYFLHNAVETIEKMAADVAEWVPEARITIAHGQMHERELERIMADFYHHRSNVLICTTIIESGIDIPSANTIIIDRADKLGLAQLHQLRGRVGRSHHQAYAYLLIPSHKPITPDAEKRLDAIAALEDLGAGFTLATHDLEIRGAGELLGEEQSGNIEAIGFSLYMELLERAVAALKSGKIPELELSLEHGAEVDLKIPALIPEDYTPDVHVRLTLYKRIANANSQQELDELQVELIDRFGLLPPQTKNLFHITEIKLRAKPLGIRKIELGAKGGRIEFEAHPHIDPGAIIQLIQQQSQHYKLEGADKLRVMWEKDTAEGRIHGILQLLEKFGKTG